LSKGKKFYHDRSEVSGDILLNVASPTFLREKICQIQDYIKSRKLPDFFPPFKEHVEEIVNFVSSQLQKYESSRSETLRDTFLFQAFTCLRLYLIQHFLLKSAERNLTNIKWVSLQNLVYSLSNQIKLMRRPVSILGDDYFAAGTPVYRECGIRIEKPFYIVVADEFDFPLFWTLIAHELAHCKLSETEHLTKLYVIASEMDLFRRLRADYCAKRIEQAMCDIIATRLLGPAFMYAYFLRLYPDFSEEHPREDPSHQFRIECMAEVLQLCRLHQIADWARERLDEKFRKSWKDEEISPLKDSLLELSNDFPLLVDKDKYEYYGSMVHVPKPDSSLLGNPIGLIVGCWFKVIEMGIGRNVDYFKRLSSIFIRGLEGASSSPNPSA